MSFFKNIIADIGKGLGAAWHAIAHLFAADILPIAIEVTEVWNTAVTSGSAQAVVDVLEGINPTAGKVAQGILDEGKVLGPKILATELGLQQLEAGSNAETDVAFANSVIEAYGSASAIQKSKVWSILATELAVLYDNGRVQDKTWIDWAKTVEAAFQAIKAAEAQAAADNADQTAS